MLRVPSLLSSNLVSFDLSPGEQLEVTFQTPSGDESWGERLSRDDTVELYLRLEQVYGATSRRDRRRARRLMARRRSVEDALADVRHWLDVWGNHFGISPSEKRRKREQAERLERELDGLA